MKSAFLALFLMAGSAVIASAQCAFMCSGAPEECTNCHVMKCSNCIDCIYQNCWPYNPQLSGNHVERSVHAPDPEVVRNHGLTPVGLDFVRGLGEAVAKAFALPSLFNRPLLAPVKKLPELPANHALLMAAQLSAKPKPCTAPKDVIALAISIQRK